MAALVMVASGGTRAEAWYRPYGGCGWGCGHGGGGGAGLALGLVGGLALGLAERGAVGYGGYGYAPPVAYAPPMAYGPPALNYPGALNVPTYYDPPVEEVPPYYAPPSYAPPVANYPGAIAPATHSGWVERRSETVVRERTTTRWSDGKGTDEPVVIEGYPPHRGEVYRDAGQDCLVRGHDGRGTYWSDECR